tara:strand:- start:410 stop:694 length:285 start_codon:yes stop_codon:yes gene_type:complete
MPAKHTKNVVLTDHHAAFVDGLVKAGRYQNASEVMREGLRTLEDRLKREEAELAELQARIALALEQADRGEFAMGTGADAVRRAFETGLGRITE